MGETLREAAASVANTIKQTFVFTGRSRRLDIVHYWIASIIVAGALTFAGTALLDWISAVIAREVIQLATAIPFFALFARRLHDQGRSAWWTFMLPPLIATNIYDNVRVNFHAFDPGWPDFGMWTFGLLILALLSLAAMFVPGDIGANRYGPDPRLTEADVSAA